MKHFIELIGEQTAHDIESLFKQETSGGTLISIKGLLSESLETISAFKVKLNGINTVSLRGNEKAQVKFDDLQLAKLENKLFALSDGLTTLVEIDKVVPHSRILNSYLENLSKTSSDKRSKIANLTELLEESIAAYEDKILSVLKKSALSTENHILSTLRELSNWKTLLMRPRIVLKIQKMREFMLSKLASFVESVLKNIDNKLTENFDDEVISKKSDVSDTVADVIYLVSCKSKLESCRKNSGLLIETEGYAKVNGMLDSAISKIGEQIEDGLNNWNVTNQAASHNIPSTIGDVIEIDGRTGQLLVNFSESLFVFLRDTRVLLDFDFASKINSSLLKMYEKGKKFYSDALSLKEIANFYSLLSTDVSDTMKPILSRSVAEFSSSLKLVIDKAKLTAKSKDNIKNNSIDMFLSSLKNASDAVTAEFEDLKGKHNEIASLLADLLNCSLLNQKYKWKQTLVKINYIVQEVKQKYGDDLTFDWRSSWDYQLFKVLQVKYREALKKFNEEINEITTTVEIKGKEVKLAPLFEELKVKLYKEIENLVKIPIIITHFSDHNEYFTVIIDQNKDLIEKLYFSVDSSVANLRKFEQELQKSIGVLFIDTEDFVKQHFTENKHWINNFEILNKKRKEMEEWKNETRVDCFRVDLVSFKDTIDSCFDRILGVFGFLLKEKVNTVASHIDAFFEESNTKLESKASSAQEILHFKQNYSDLSRQRAAVNKLIIERDELNHILSKITGTGLNFQLTGHKATKFDDLMNKYSDMVESQKEEIKKDLQIKLLNIDKELEAFLSKWKGVKPNEKAIPDEFVLK